VSQRAGTCGCLLLLQRVAAFCSVLQCVVVCCSVAAHRYARAPVVVAVRCCVLQCVEVCCSALRCRNAPVYADASPTDTIKDLWSLPDCTVFFCQHGRVVDFHLINVIRRNFLVPFRYQRPKGKSAGQALKYSYMIRRVGRYCSRLQSVAAFCSVLHCFAQCCRVLQRVAVCCSVLQCVAVCFSVLQCVAVCCSVLQCVAVSCTVLQSAASFGSVLK